MTAQLSLGGSLQIGSAVLAIVRYERPCGTFVGSYRDVTALDHGPIMPRDARNMGPRNSMGTGGVFWSLWTALIAVDHDRSVHAIEWF